MSPEIFAFELLPQRGIECPLSLKAAMAALAGLGERCPGRLDAAVALDCQGPWPMNSGAMGALLIACGFHLVPVCDDLGSASLFFDLPDEDAPYARAWSAMESLALDRALALGPASHDPRL